MSKPKNPAKKTRFNLVLSESTKESLERILVEINADSYSEVIRRSVVMFDCIIRIAKKTGKIYLKTESGERELIIPEIKEENCELEI